MSVVYFIQSGADGPIKIGMAGNMKKRIASLQCGNPNPLVVLGTVKGGRSVERRFHQSHAAERLRGEWFSPTSDLLATIAAARRGIIPGEPMPVNCLSLDSSTLTWKLVDDTAFALNVEPATRYKWRQPNRGVPPKWRIKIMEHLLSQGVPVALADFDRLETTPGRIAA